MTEYESNQYREIQKWKRKKSRKVNKVVSNVTKPFSWAFNLIIPSKAVEAALISANWVAKGLTDTKDIKRDARVSDISELRHKDLELSDKLANEVQNWACGIASAEGAATGLGGALTIAIDIPTIITMCLRTIHKIGLCYGYEMKSEMDRALVFSIMSLASANSTGEKAAALAEVQKLKVLIKRQSWKAMEEIAKKKVFTNEALLVYIRKQARSLGPKITKKIAQRALPIIGAVVGAGMNLYFINSVSWAARRTFQEMWLQENGKIPQIEDADITEFLD